MKNWVPMLGNFQREGNKIRYVGGLTEYIDSVTKTNKTIGLAGKLLFNELFYNGIIEMKAEFEDIDENDEIEIIFNNEDENKFSCIGLTNSIYKYEYKNYDGMWNYNKVTGQIPPLSSKNIYKIKAEIIGSVVTLYIDDIKIFSSYLNIPLKRTTVGVWVRSTSSIIIHDFTSTYNRPKAFVVMQFGKNYDDLYFDVIKPICEEKGYEVYRADESMQTGLVINDIIESIKNAAVIIADITPDNPNVFYEIGFSHALNKDTILLNEKEKREKLPFDISGFRTIFYDNSIGGKKEVEEKLKRFLGNINVNIPS